MELSKLSSDTFYFTENDPHIQLKGLMELSGLDPGKYASAERHLIIEFGGDVADYLERKKRSGQSFVKHRDIFRRFKKIKEADLLIVLDFLKTAKIISWDREQKKVTFHPSMGYLGSFLVDIKLARDEIKKSGEILESTL
jgi:hypothetical protein